MWNVFRMKAFLQLEAGQNPPKTFDEVWQHALANICFATVCLHPLPYVYKQLTPPKKKCANNFSLNNAPAPLLRILHFSPAFFAGEILWSCANKGWVMDFSYSKIRSRFMSRFMMKKFVREITSQVSEKKPRDAAAGVNKVISTLTSGREQQRIEFRNCKKWDCYPRFPEKKDWCMQAHTSKKNNTTNFFFSVFPNSQVWMIWPFSARVSTGNAITYCPTLCLHRDPERSARQQTETLSLSAVGGRGRGVFRRRGSANFRVIFKKGTNRRKPFVMFFSGFRRSVFLLHGLSGALTCSDFPYDASFLVSPRSFLSAAYARRSISDSGCCCCWGKNFYTLAF